MMREASYQNRGAVRGEGSDPASPSYEGIHPSPFLHFFY